MFLNLQKSVYNVYKRHGVSNFEFNTWVSIIVILTIKVIL